MGPGIWLLRFRPEAPASRGPWAPGSEGEPAARSARTKGRRTHTVSLPASGEAHACSRSGQQGASCPRRVSQERPRGGPGFPRTRAAKHHLLRAATKEAWGQAGGFREQPRRWGEGFLPPKCEQGRMLPTGPLPQGFRRPGSF